MKSMGWVVVGGGVLGGLTVYDLLQKRHAILRNFPVIGHGRYLVESIGPELRQYIVTSNDEERPFSRDQRSWIYSSSKLANNYFGFGTDNDLEYASGPIIKHRTFPVAPTPASLDGSLLPSAKVMGAARGRTKAFRPQSLVNISGMSYGSLSGNAIEALNRGAAIAGCLHNTGEGGLSPYHRNGGDLIFQLGTSYFGCRDKEGRFDLAQLKEVVESAPVRALEIKLSQGAKPGLGGHLPGAKVSPKIAEVRGIEVGKDCASPARHTAFTDVDSMLDFVELLAEETGLPVGIKSAVGDMTFWNQLADQMAPGDRGVDYVFVDGGEGGTGAAPMIFADSVAYPFRLAFTKVYGRFAAAGLTDDVTFIGAGRLGVPDNALVALALGVDMINVAREAMLSIGCVQAQRCHTDACPTGVATQNAWLARGLDPVSKADRAANYITALRRDLLKVAGAVGVPHPGMIGPDDIDLADGSASATPLREVYGYQPSWGRLGGRIESELTSLMT